VGNRKHNFCETKLMIIYLVWQKNLNTCTSIAIKFKTSDCSIHRIVSAKTLTKLKTNIINNIPMKKYSNFEKTEEELLSFSGYNYEELIKEVYGK
tara:strand:- start:18664 stop:18948 length:285 start_codon:yes stop_codon:yes gene_type:complete